MPWTCLAERINVKACQSPAGSAGSSRDRQLSNAARTGLDERADSCLVEFAEDGSAGAPGREAGAVAKAGWVIVVISSASAR
jgi:hypothetical protein